MKEAHIHNYTEVVRQALLSRGIIQLRDSVFLQPIAVNRDRKDARFKRMFRVLRGSETLCHLTIGKGLRILYERALGFSAACPEITCKPLFYEKCADFELFAQEFFDGISIEQGYADGRFTEEAITLAIQTVVDALEVTLVASTSQDMELELVNFRDELLKEIEFSEFDIAFLDNVVFPLITEKISRILPRKRWTNGDLISRNILLNDQLKVKLIDYEFATNTHFFAEDWIRLEKFSVLPKALVNYSVRIPKDGTEGIDLFFWLRQTLLEFRVNKIHHFNENLSQKIEEIYRILNTTDFGARNSFFLRDVFLKNDLNLQLAQYEQQLAQKNELLVEKCRQLGEKNLQLATKNQELAEKMLIISIKDQFISDLLSSYSWRITALFRKTIDFLRGHWR